MRICIVTPSFNGGGAERIAMNLANYYAEIGHNVTIIAFKAIGFYTSQVSNKVKIIDLNSRARHVIFKLLFSLKRAKPELIISVIRQTNILVGFASLFIKSRIIYREANTMNAIHIMPRLKSILYVFLMRLSYPRADKIIANSFDTKADLIKYKIIARDNKAEVIGNPVLPLNFESLIHEKINHYWLGNPEYKSILNVGRLHPQKNQALLISAFKLVNAQIANTRLIILGEGDEKENLLNLAKELGIAELIDIIPFQKNPFPFYKAANVFVLTSEWEGFGNVIVEAMACESPVISTNCLGGPKMILNNGEFGQLVQSNNEIELANSIIKEINHPASFNQITKAKHRALEYSLPKVAEKYLAI